MTTADNKTEPVLVLEGLRKSYGAKVAVDDVSLTVHKGEIFGLIGANGAGKTSTIECALGTRTRDAGKLWVLGMDPVRDRKKLFARVGVQFQESRFQDKISVREACLCAAALYPETRDWRPLLERFGLAGKEKAFVQALSGGERQKLAVVLALIPNPELVFLDELSTGLDPAARRAVWQFLKELQAEGTTIVLSSHYMEEVEYLCDRVAILSKGRIVRTGRPADLVLAEQAAHQAAEQAGTATAKQNGIKNLEDVFLACVDEADRQDYHNSHEEASA